jgi:vacuolar protein sorting-associated protein 13A/C
MPYALDDPTQTEKVIRLTSSGQQRDINVMEIGTQIPFKLAVSSQAGHMIGFAEKADFVYD